MKKIKLNISPMLTFKESKKRSDTLINILKQLGYTNEWEQDFYIMMGTIEGSTMLSNSGFIVYLQITNYKMLNDKKVRGAILEYLL